MNLNSNQNSQAKIFGNIRHARALLAPTSTQGISGKPLFFLFSVFQVEDIVREVAVQKVPFSPDYAEGIALWRDYVVPVLSLEKCLGLEINGHSKERQRYILVRSVEDRENRKRALIKTLSGIRMISLPIKNTPVSFYHMVSNPRLVRGLFEWQGGFLLIVHLEKILMGIT